MILCYFNGNQFFKNLIKWRFKRLSNEEFVKILKPWFENLDEKMIKQAFERSCEKVEFALLDWKGMGKEKTRIIELLEKLNIEYKRTDKL